MSYALRGFSTLALILICLLTMPAASVWAQDLMLPNPEMTLGQASPAKWEKVWQGNAAPPAPQAVLSRDTGRFVSKPASLRLDVPAGAGPANTRLRITPHDEVKEAGTFKIAGQMRFEGKGIAIIAIEGLDAKWKRVFTQNVTTLDKPTADGKWLPLEAEITYPAGLRRLVIVVGMVQGDGSVWLDDLKLTGKGVVEPEAEKPFVFDSSYETTKTLKETKWAESTWRAATGAITLDDSQTPTVVAVEVKSKGEAVLMWPMTVEAGKVYRVEIVGRGVGQIEGLGMYLRRQSAPYTGHGSDSWPPSREWTTYTTQIRPAVGDDQTLLFLTFSGVGRFEIRSVRITRHESFEVPKPQGPPRGEMLFNRDFALNGAGWVYNNPAWGHNKRKFFEAESKPGFVRDDKEASARFVAPAGIMGFLDPLKPFRFYFGRTYILTVKGDAGEGDLYAWLARGGQNFKIAEKKPLAFKDGAARVVFNMNPPQSGALPNDGLTYFLRLEHMGKAPLQITEVSFVETSESDAPQPPAPPAPPVASEKQTLAEAAIELTDLVDPFGSHTLVGTPMGVELLARNVDASAALTLCVTNAWGREISRTPLALKAGTDGLAHATTSLDLPVGWYELTISGPDALETLPRQIAVLPREVKDAKPGFLGGHIQDDDPRRIAQARRIGFHAARCFGFGWPGIEPKEGEFTNPLAHAEEYLDAGVEPMIILNGSPRWIADAPQKMLENPSPWAGWSSYPPRRIEAWSQYCQRMTESLKGRVHHYEIWNEPNAHFLKQPPDSKKTHPQMYVELVQAAAKAIRQTDPDAKIVAGVTAGLDRDFMRECFRLGMLEHCDIISYHAYGQAQTGRRGPGQYQGDINWLRQQMKAHGRQLPIWDSESGFAIGQGRGGLNDAISALQSIISSQVAGIQRQYIYNVDPREFPNHSNFQMTLGFGDAPLVSQPMLAVYDRLLNGATFANSLGQEEKGVHVYEFKRADGQSVFVGWISDGKPLAWPSEIPATHIVLDAFGQPVKATSQEQPGLDTDLRYACPPEVVKMISAE